MPADLPPVLEAAVRAARLAPSPADEAFSIIRIAPEALQAHPRLDEAVTAVPGASLFRRTSSAGANPTTQGLSLRAIAPSGAGRALVTLDGAPQNDPFGGWVIWSALPPESIGSAAIVRGAGAGPYGAGALTGVVTLDSVEAPALRADLAAGGLGYRRAALAAASGPAAVSLSAEHDDGWIPVRAGRGPADAPLSLDAGSAAVRVRKDAGPAVLSARLGLYRETRGSGLQGADARAQGAQASVSLVHAEAQAGWRLQAWASASDLRNRSVAVAADRSGTTPANDQYATPATGYGFNAALRGGGPDALWEFGGDLRAAEGEAREHFRYQSGAFTRDRRSGGQSLVLGVYGEGERRQGDWLLTGGARIDRWSSTDARRQERDLATGALTLDEHPQDRDGWIPTARAGVRRDWQGAYGRAAAYAGFRPPTLNELHRPFRVGNDITEANPELVPERLYGVEAAVGGAGWSVTAFYNRLDDPVTNVTLGQGPATFPIAGFVPAGGVLRQRRNAGRIDADGVEAEAHAALAPTLTFQGAVSYTDARVDGGSAAPQLTGLRPAQAPSVSATAGLDWRPRDHWSLQLSAAFEGARFEDDINSRRLGAATTVSGRAAWAVARDAEIYLAADNLFDAAEPTGMTADGVTSYGTPRAVRMGLSVRR